MGNFAPMKCPYCGAGPYSGPTLGDREDDPHARQRWYDCGTWIDANGDMEWRITERCADLVAARVHRLVELEDMAGWIVSGIIGGMSDDELLEQAEAYRAKRGFDLEP